MHAPDLEKCLRDLNATWLDRLEAEHSLPKPPIKSTPAARVYALPPPPSDTLRPTGPGPGFHGWATEGNPFDLRSQELWITLTSPDDGSARGRVSVGAVLDKRSDPGRTGGSPPGDDLPVVLAVGINYGQQQARDYLQRPPGIYDDTGLRPGLEAVVNGLMQRGHHERPLKNGYYHLVAANFFPWITTEGWADCTKSVLTEELLLRYFGWPNPLEFIYALVPELHRLCRDVDRPEQGLTHVVFHGAQSAAARCGVAVVAQLTQEITAAGLERVPLHRASRPLADPSHPRGDQWPAPEVILCDNLAPPQPDNQIHNAVRLWWDNPNDQLSVLRGLEQDE